MMMMMNLKTTELDWFSKLKNTNGQKVP